MEQGPARKKSILHNSADNDSLHSHHSAHHAHTDGQNLFIYFICLYFQYSDAMLCFEFQIKWTDTVCIMNSDQKSFLQPNRCIRKNLHPKIL